MTVKQAAERIGISRSLLYRLIDEGRLPHRRIGKAGCRGKIVLTEEGIAAFLRRCEVATDER